MPTRFVIRTWITRLLLWREQRDDVAAYDAARASGEVAIPFEQAIAEIEAAEQR